MRPTALPHSGPVPRLEGVPTRDSGWPDARVRHVAREFEALFLGQLLKTVRGRAAGVGLLARSPAEDLVREFYHEELGRALAHGGGIGLADLLVATLRRQLRV